MIIYEKYSNFEGKPSFKKWCIYCRRYGHSIADCGQKQPVNINRPQKHSEPSKSFYHYLKKIKVYQTKLLKVTIAQKNHFQIAVAIADYKPPIDIPFAKDHQIDEI